MTQQEFLKEVEISFGECLNLIKQKNADYAGPIDPFKNFRGAGVIDITPEKAVLIRILDKIARVNNLLSKKTPSVSSESIEDTLMDMANYAIILKVMLSTERRFD